MTTTIQIQPCTKVGEDVIWCNTSEASFFGVYIGQPGSFEWLADFASRLNAYLYATKQCEQCDYTLDDCS